MVLSFGILEPTEREVTYGLTPSVTLVGVELVPQMCCIDGVPFEVQTLSFCFRTMKSLDSNT